MGGDAAYSRITLGFLIRDVYVTSDATGIRCVTYSYHFIPIQ